MQNLFLVSVAIGILSGTNLTAKAQPAVNLEQVNVNAVQKKSVRFIEGIEINGPFVGGGSTIAPAPAAAGEAVAIESFSSLQFKYALLLDMEVETITNKPLFTQIDKWWGTRYKYGGATLQGIDCSAYTGTLVHSVYGIVLPRTSRDQYDACIKIEKEQMLQGDLVFFKTGRGISHVGMYLGNGYFTHASTSIGVTVSHLSEAYWEKKFVGAGRLTANPTEE